MKHPKEVLIRTKQDIDNYFGAPKPSSKFSPVDAARAFGVDDITKMFYIIMLDETLKQEAAELIDELSTPDRQLLQRLRSNTIWGTMSKMYVYGDNLELRTALEDVYDNIIVPHYQQ